MLIQNQNLKQNFVIADVQLAYHLRHGNDSVAIDTAHVEPLLVPAHVLRSHNWVQMNRSDLSYYLSRLKFLTNFQQVLVLYVLKRLYVYLNFVKVPLHHRYV